MTTVEHKFRGLEIWDIEDVPLAVRDEATEAALAVLDAKDVSPLEARVAQFRLESMDDSGALDDGNPSDHGLNMEHLKAGREAEDAARKVIERLAPNRAEPYSTLGVEEWALNEWLASKTDPTKK